MSLKIAVAGDVSFRHPFATEKDYRVALQQIQPIFTRADYRIVNLENPVAAQTDAPIPKNGPAIGCRAEDLIFLELLQCDCAILANNHMKDFGEKAVLRTTASAVCHPESVLLRIASGTCPAQSAIDDSGWLGASPRRRSGDLTVADDGCGRIDARENPAKIEISGRIRSKV